MSLLPDLMITEIIAAIGGLLIAGLWAWVERKGRQREKQMREEAEGRAENLRRIREIERETNRLPENELVDRLTDRQLPPGR